MKLRQIVLGKDTPEPRAVVVIEAAASEDGQPPPAAWQGLPCDTTCIIIPPEHFAAVRAAGDQWEALLNVLTFGGKPNFRALGPDAFVLGVTE